MSFPIEQGLFKYDLTDHYAILGVPISADSRKVRQRYLEIAYILHPDTFQGEKQSEKTRANKILSKLVNPAYETLSKDRSRIEYSLVLSQMGQNLSRELSSITVATDEAQKLLQTSQNVELVYHKLLTALITEQYKDLEQVFNKIAQISELNLIYLMIQQGQEVKAKARTNNRPPVNSSPPVDQDTTTKEPESAIDASLRRAQDYIKRNKTSQAIIELRESLKTDPNNGTCHGLLGLAYLKENQLTMAKVHINKACKVSPQDPIVIKAKQSLDQVAPDAEKSKSSDKSKGGGLFGLFGKKK
ncbi:MAG: J domain-containing protein [Cyanobacteria bacterium P01_G01_bin.49]